MGLLRLSIISNVSFELCGCHKSETTLVMKAKSNVVGDDDLKNLFGKLVSKWETSILWRLFRAPRQTMYPTCGTFAEK